MSKLLSIFSAVAMIAVSATGFAENEELSANASNGAMNNQKNQKPAFFEQGMGLSNDKVVETLPYPRGYNAPACIRVDNSWDFNANISFIYWYMGQDAMDLAFVTPVPNATPALIVPGVVSYQNMGYNPGFQVGIGMDHKHDGWTSNAEYTWYHNSESQSGVASPSATTTFKPSDFAPVLAETGTFTNYNSTWTMHMDLLDVTGGRPFYQGRYVTVAPSGGLRALWIRQNEAVSYNTATTATSVTGGSNSWALGVVGNVNAHVMIWKGLRVDSIMGASLLYTQYTKIYNNFATATTSVNSVATNVSAVRPTFDMGLGLAYGAYCFKNKFYVDLSARYDFNIFWAQNMMRNFASQLQGFDDAIGDLFLHGLTLNLRCDF